MMADENDKPKDENVSQVNGAGAGFVISLRRPVSAHGDEIKELKFREPTAGDIEICGNPVNIDFVPGETPKLSFNSKSMSAMMSTLASVPPSTIRQLHTRDWNTAAWNLASFFMPDL
jgi:Phage tail assembly chaperone proteins, E, or 41 or 14